MTNITYYARWAVGMPARTALRDADAEIACLRKTLLLLWVDGSVRAAIGEGSELYERVQRVL